MVMTETNEQPERACPLWITLHRTTRMHMVRRERTIDKNVAVIVSFRERTCARRAKAA